MAKYCREVKKLIIELINDLSDNIFETDEEKGDMMLVGFFFSKLSPERAMHHVIQKILPHKRKIEDRDLDFFLENRHLFSGLSEEKITYYINYVVTNTTIPQETREVVWEYFDELIYLAEKYRKIK